jgi:hypothetical protein
MFDTGSSAMWLLSESCRTCPVSPGRYNHSESIESTDTSLEAAPIYYADGAKIQGHIVKDTVKIGDYSFQDFAFINADNYTTNNDLTESDFSGLLGLMFEASREYAQGVNMQPFTKRLFFESNKTGSSIPKRFSFSIYEGEQNGEMVIGGVNSARIAGQVVELPVESDSQNSDGSPKYNWWKSTLSNLFVGTSMPSNVTVDKIVIFDTGSSLAYIPRQAALDLHQQLGSFNTSEVKRVFLN